MYCTEIHLTVLSQTCSMFPSLTLLPAVRIVFLYNRRTLLIATMLFDSYSERLLPSYYNLSWDSRILPWVPYYDGDIQVTLKAESLYQYYSKVK